MPATASAPVVPTTEGTYALAVSLHFTDDYSSNKEYHVLLQGNTVVTAYGRRHMPGNGGTDRFETFEKAAAVFWSTVRAKTGKGYRVVDAMVIRPEDIYERPYDTLRRGWMPDCENRLRSGVAANQPQPPVGYRELSPRTSKTGRLVIQWLSSREASEDFLLECALAADTERFLWPLALSHPNCPDSARVARALTAMAN